MQHCRFPYSLALRFLLMTRHFLQICCIVASFAKNDIFLIVVRESSIML
jgi:hypothetical protein